MNDPIELQKRIDELEAAYTDLEIHLQRASIWALNLSSHLCNLQNRVNSFAAGVTNAPWMPRESRVVGYRSEFAAMVEASKTPTPELGSFEDTKKAMLAEHKA
jgi:hypothetical protein